MKHSYYYYDTLKITQVQHAQKKTNKNKMFNSNAVLCLSDSRPAQKLNTAFPHADPNV